MPLLLTIKIVVDDTDRRPPNWEIYTDVVWLKCFRHSIHCNKGKMPTRWTPSLRKLLNRFSLDQSPSRPDFGFWLTHRTLRSGTDWGKVITSYTLSFIKSISVLPFLREKGEKEISILQVDVVEELWRVWRYACLVGRTTVSPRHQLLDPNPQSVASRTNSRSRGTNDGLH